jgi:cell division protein FtsB
MSFDFLSIINVVIGLAALVGVFVAFLRSNKTEITRIQEETINAFKARLELLEKRQTELEKENTSLKQVLETIKAALKQKGFHVTIDGDMVIIEDDSSSISARRRAASKQTKDNN